MPTLSENEIATILAPYLVPPMSILPQLSAYLDLLLRWNSRTNLTAIRDPQEIVRRHFGESLFAAKHLDSCDSLLDLGSGAGFPGVPIALLWPETRVTLAESQNKKAGFLREAVRTLNLPNMEIWEARAESLPKQRQFQTVALRAVDDMPTALLAAEPVASRQLLLLTSSAAAPVLPGFPNQTRTPIPESKERILLIAARF